MTKILKDKYFVYALKSIHRNYIYVGLTNNVEQRFNQHNNGYEKTTRPYSPFSILYTEEFSTRKAAREKEKYLKSGIGKEWLKQL